MKKIKYLIMFFILFISFETNLKAAVCRYNDFNISVYNGNANIEINSNSKYYEGYKASINSLTFKTELFDNGKCPTIYFTEFKKNGTITVTTSKTSGSIAQSPKQTTVNNENRIYCYYNGYKVIILNNQPEISFTSTKSSSIKTSNFDVSGFSNGKCPNTYMSCMKQKGEETCTFSTSVIKGTTGKGATANIATKVQNEYTGEVNDNPDSTIIGSGEVLSSEMINILNEIYLVIKIIAPILAIALSMLDFTKAIGQDDKDILNKSFKRLVIRIIVVLLIFMLPALVNLIAKISGLELLPNGLFS